MFKTSHLQELKRRYREMYAPKPEELDEHCGVCGEGGEHGVEEDTDKDTPGTQGDQAEYQKKRKEIAKKFGVDACAQLKDEDKKKACFAALDAAHVSDDEEKEKKEDHDCEEAHPDQSHKEWEKEQKEEVEIDEADKKYPPTIETLKMIVKDKQNQIVKFKDGNARVDGFSASAMTQVYDAMKKPELKKKFEDQLKTKAGFLKIQAFSFSMVK